MNLSEFNLQRVTRVGEIDLSSANLQKANLQGAILRHANLGYGLLYCTFLNHCILRGERITRDEKGEIANIFTLAPHWTIEILSPGQSQTKVTKNILHCLKHGTEMGWLIDPDEQTIFVYRPQQEVEVYDQLDLLLSVPSFAQELHLTVQDIFTCLIE